ncbi:TPA: hypothetical protein EYG96_01505 [Candidatus Gracilibacteria bacterium]|nr:hypothetical protein [Candidatus Peregrinibacteria bacterium]HIQ56699.1 hypothetical protein [Candidatus Gracilibacteria bacterium]HIQ57479.1 hypothetical protein [Candidatus Gracilibacteria bacterium]
MTNLNNFAENLKNTIQEKEIEQIPSWVFWSKNIAIFIFFTLSVIIGAFALSLVFYSIFERGFEGIRPMHTEFLTSIPLLWLFFFVIFLLFAIFGIKHFPRAYKLTSLIFIAGNILISFLLGFILYCVNIPEHFTSFHNNIEIEIEKDWNNPEEGLLAGKIISEIYEKKLERHNKYIKIKTIENKIWEIKIEDSKFLEHIQNKKHRANKKNPLRIIKLKGYISENKNIFIAENILPLHRNRFK